MTSKTSAVARAAYFAAEAEEKKNTRARGVIVRVLEYRIEPENKTFVPDTEL